MVIGELVKHQFNHGMDNNLFFYRDKGQHEVDVIIDDGLQDLKAYEIKLSPVSHPDFYKNLNYFKSLFEKETKITQVINTGATSLNDSFTGHINYKDLDLALDTTDS